MSTLPTKNNEAIPPSPPRLFGNAEQDAAVVSQWVMQFIQASYRENKTLDPEFHANPGDFDGTGDVPDPTQTSLAQAQSTANYAFEGLASKAEFNTGSFTISNTADQSVVTFTGEFSDTSYFISCQAMSVTGSPASGAFAIKSIVKATDGFTATLVQAPGSGTSVTYDFIVIY